MEASQHELVDLFCAFGYDVFENAATGFYMRINPEVAYNLEMLTPWSPNIWVDPLGRLGQLCITSR